MMKCCRDDDYETCCLCHKKLEIPKDRPVWNREFYIEGAGQLCGPCYREVYENSARGRMGCVSCQNNR